MLRAPLSVHLAGLGDEEHYEVDDLEFTVSARGGYMSASFSVPQWVDSAERTLRPVSRVMIDDGRNARRVFEGFLDIPGKTVSENGHDWKIGAVGSSSVLADRARKYVAIDSDMTAWPQSTATAMGSNLEIGTLPADDDVPAIVMQFPAGLPVDNSSVVKMYYKVLFDNGQRLGGVGYTRVGGKLDANFRQKMATREVAGPLQIIRDSQMTTTTFVVADEVTTSWTNPMCIVNFQLTRDTGGATNITTDNTWCAFSNVWVRAQLRNLDGSYIATAGAHINPYVKAHEVIKDALTHFTNQVDIAGASIDSSFTQQISQLAYADPVRLPDILNDLAMIEPELVWECLESNTNNKHRFNVRKWPTDTRYEADSVDGWDSPGSEYDLSTNATISWVAANEEQKSYAATFSVPALEQWGRLRDVELIDLGSELGGTAVATAIGNALAAKMEAVPYAGTLTVARPIRDLYTGRYVQPWEIKPGYLLNVRDIDAPPMQLTEMTYHDSDMSSELTLGTPLFSLDELMAKLARRRTRRKGKPKALAPS